MVPAHLPSSTPQPQSPYPLVKDWARHASLRVLLLLLYSSLLLATGIMSLALTLWPFAALLGTAAAVALWGLAAHRSEAHPSRLLQWLQAAAIAIGTLLAILGGMALFFGLLGPRWNL